MVFDGAPPATVGDLRAVLESSLAANQRVLASLSVDHRPFVEEQAGVRLDAVARVEVTSLALAEALAEAAKGLAPEFIALQQEADALACAVVREPWLEVQERCVRLIEATAQAMQRGLDVATLAGENSAPASAVAGLAQAVDACLNAIKERDAAGVCLQLDGAVLPSCARVVGVFRGEGAS